MTVQCGNREGAMCACRDSSHSPTMLAGRGTVLSTSASGSRAVSLPRVPHSPHRMATRGGVPSSSGQIESIVHVPGIAALLERRNYKAVLLDQFGVLHDGRAPYSDGTISCVRRLVEAGLRIYIISNSSRRSSGTIDKLQRLGFDPTWFEGMPCMPCMHARSALQAN